MMPLLRALKRLLRIRRPNRVVGLQWELVPYSFEVSYLSDLPDVWSGSSASPADSKKKRFQPFQAKVPRFRSSTKSSLISKE